MVIRYWLYLSLLVFLYPPGLSLHADILVYEPEVSLQVIGDVRTFEERKNGELIQSASFAEPGKPLQFFNVIKDTPRKLSWEYDESGYEITEMLQSRSGEWELHSRFSYDKDHLKSLTIYDADDEILEQRNYRYAETGQVSRESIYDAKGRVKIIYSYVHGSDGTVDKYTESSGRKALTIRYQFDESGNLVLKETHNARGMETRNYYVFDELGNLSEHFEYDYREVLVQRVAYDYSQEGFLQSVVHFDRKDYPTFGIFYTREQIATIEKITITNHRGELAGDIEIFKDSIGNMVSMREIMYLWEGRLITEYLDYDGKNNWQKKEVKTYTDNMLEDRVIYTRSIGYFD